MSNNDINKNLPVFTEFKYPLNQSLNTSLIEDIVSNTPHKDLFFHIKPQMNMNNILLNMNNIPHLLMSDLKSPNKYSSLSIKKKEDVFYFYGGGIINENLTFEEQANEEDRRRNIMTVLVKDLDNDFDEENVTLEYYL